MDTQDKVRKILGLVNRAYGRPAKLKKTDPIDELIRTILSQNTNDRNSLGAFSLLKKRFRSWSEVMVSDTRLVAGTIRHAGLANIKAGRIKEVLKEIVRREGRLSLSSLNGLRPDAALEYLRSIKGIGPKTAACVLLFSFAKPVMPVDTHIFRVTKRLGLLSEGSSIEDAHDKLTRMVSPGLIYNFHLSIIEHGRKTCKAQRPDCGSCVLYDICKFKKKAFFKKRIKA